MEQGGPSKSDLCIWADRPVQAALEESWSQAVQQSMSLSLSLITFGRNGAGPLPTRTAA